MSAFRVTMTFDLDIGDEVLARDIAKQFMDDLSLSTIADGGSVKGDSAETVRSPQAVASTVAFVLLARGVETAPGITVANVQVENDVR